MKLPEPDRLQHPGMDGQVAGGESPVQLMKLPEHGPLQYAVMDGHSAGAESAVHG
jgi:hypothetical protein